MRATPEQIAAVRAKAQAETDKWSEDDPYGEAYEWSVIVECYSDSDIAEEIEEQEATTIEEALAVFKKIVKIRVGSDYGGKGSENW